MYTAAKTKSTPKPPPADEFPVKTLAEISEIADRMRAEAEQRRAFVDDIRGLALMLDGLAWRIEHEHEEPAA